MPVSGWIGDGEKGIFPEPHPASKKVATVPESEGYSWDDGFCDFAFGSAQNDRVGIGMSESFGIREIKLKGV